MWKNKNRRAGFNRGRSDRGGKSDRGRSEKIKYSKSARTSREDVTRTDGKQRGFRHEEFGQSQEPYYSGTDKYYEDPGGSQRTQTYDSYNKYEGDGYSQSYRDEYPDVRDNEADADFRGKDSDRQYSDRREYDSQYQGAYGSKELDKWNQRDGRRYENVGRSGEYSRGHEEGKFSEHIIYEQKRDSEYEKSDGREQQTQQVQYDRRQYDSSYTDQTAGSFKDNSFRSSETKQFKTNKTRFTSRSLLGEFKKSSPNDSVPIAPHRSSSGPKHDQRKPRGYHGNRDNTDYKKDGSLQNEKSSKQGSFVQSDLRSPSADFRGTAKASDKSWDKAKDTKQDSSSLKSRNNDLSSKYGSRHTQRSETGGFKTPAKVLQQRPRSNSGRKHDLEKGYYDDDIISILADDDEFIGDHGLSSSRYGSSTSLNRQNTESSKAVNERSTDYRQQGPSYQRDWHAEQNRMSGSKEGKADTVTNYSQELNISFASPRRDGTESRRETSQSGRFTRSSNIPVHSSAYSNSRKVFGKNVKRGNNFFGKNVKRGNKTSQFGTGARQFSDKFSRLRTNRSKFSAVGNKTSIANKFQTKNLRREIGKTGAILKEDREVDASSNRNDRGSQKHGFGFGQNNHRESKFKAVERVGAIDNVGVSKFRNVPHHERVKQKYFKSRFGTKFNERTEQTVEGRKRREEFYPRGRREKDKQNKDREMKKQDVKKETKHITKDHKQKNKPVPRHNLGNIHEVREARKGENEEQQIMYISHPDTSSQMQMLDEFGPAILNPDMDFPQGNEQLPLQYIPQPFSSEGNPPGEQMVFIPFINTPGAPGFGEGPPVMYGESEPQDFRARSQEQQTSAPKPKRPALSKEARAQLRRKLAFKRKKRLEKEIEERLLKKLLKNPKISLTSLETTKEIKKPIIKRISPPSSSKPSSAGKKLKAVSRQTIGNDLEEISDENVYDNVSDLEDVSDSEEEREQRPERRQGFRKPGEVRKRAMQFPGAKVSDDVRKVVDSSLKSHKRRDCKSTDEQAQNTGNLESHSESFKRSVYIENPKGSSKSQAVVHKREAERHEHKPLKKRRSLSPLEITVSNDRYSKTRKSPEDSSIGKFDRNKNEEKHEKNRPVSEEGFRKYAKGDQDRVTSSCKDSVKQDRSEKESDRGYTKRGYDGTRERLEKRGERQTGKYRAESRHEKYEKDKEKKKEYSDVNFGNSRKDDHKPERKYEHRSSSRERTQKKERERSRSREKRYEDGSSRNKDDRTEYRRSKSSERDKKDEESEYRRRGKASDRGREERKRSRSRERMSDRDHSGSRRTYKDETYHDRESQIISSHSQYQMPLNQPFLQSSVKQQQFMTSHSQAMAFQNQPMGQYQNASSVDYSLPPVHTGIAPMSMPPVPPPGLGVAQDMSLPPPMTNMGSSGNTFIPQQSNSMPFQQQMNMQQQQFQLQQLQRQHQMIPQTNTSQFQQQSLFPSAMANQQSSHFQSNISIMPSSQNLVSNQMASQAGPVNKGRLQGGRHVLSSSTQRGSFIATTPQQAVRGVLGTIKHTGPVSRPVLRGSHGMQIEGQVGMAQVLSKARAQYGMDPSPGGLRNIGSNYSGEKDDEDEDDDEDNLCEMLCSKCDKVFLSFELMRRHGKWHDMVESSNKTWRCDHCEQAFSGSSLYSDHMARKHTKDSWNCSLCDTSFSNSSSLNRHVRQGSHKDLKVKFVCSLCPASFMVLSQLVVHKRENHQGSSGTWSLRKF